MKIGEDTFLKQVLQKIVFNILPLLIAGFLIGGCRLLDEKSSNIILTLSIILTIIYTIVVYRSVSPNNFGEACLTIIAIIISWPFVFFGMWILTLIILMVFSYFAISW